MAFHCSGNSSTWGHDKWIHFSRTKDQQSAHQAKHGMQHNHFRDGW